jgi:DNA invertase Pin-like site-specific DNA recombinase
MTVDISAFNQFGNRPKKITAFVESNLVVSYSRVSGKEQFDTNLSLETQTKAIEEYCRRNGKTIAASFGGTYESAKTDGRKEFKRMLDYIAKHKGKISQIVVYMTDRFSRTGGSAIKLAHDLREKYGVTIYAVAQPTDTRDETGAFSQDLQLLFSNYDNKLRRKRTISGMKAKLEKGIWVTRPPQGYDIVKVNGERKLVINKEGLLIRKAFLWKAEGVKNEAILERLKALGLKMIKQQLTKTFKRPFYCGIINHGLLDGKVIEGKHEKLISYEVFLKVNEINEKAVGFNIPHKKENDYLPLKVFLKCDRCGEPLTGYERRKKTKTKVLKFYYYKCRTNGCKCNRNAAELHQLFEDLLTTLQVSDELMAPIQYEMERFYEECSKDNVEKEASLKKQLAAVEKKIEDAEESLLLKNVTLEVYNKFNNRYQEERAKILKELTECSKSISNLPEALKRTLSFTRNLSVAWRSSEATQKEELQKLIFPEGIVYDREKRAFRTPKMNLIFQLIAHQLGNFAYKEKGTYHYFYDKSLLAEKEGFEPPDLLQSKSFKP